MLRLAFLGQLYNFTTHRFLNNWENVLYSKLFFEEQKCKADVLNKKWCFVENILVFVHIEKNLCEDGIMRKAKVTCTLFSK